MSMKRFAGISVLNFDVRVILVGQALGLIPATLLLWGLATQAVPNAVVLFCALLLVLIGLVGPVTIWLTIISSLPQGDDERASVQ